MRRFPRCEDAIATFEQLQREAMGLHLLQDKLGPRATLEDALKVHRALRQQGRRLARCLREPE